MKTDLQTPEVIATRKETDRLLSLVPDKCYSDCNVAERAAFDNHSAALTRHRAAVRIARAALSAPSHIEEGFGEDAGQALSAPQSDLTATLVDIAKTGAGQ